jgi:photosystem II stability/assembly factor-like uncharacterized protein
VLPSLQRSLSFVGASLLLAGTAPTLGAQAAIPVAEEFNALHFRSIGPATMSGRIADVAVYEANPAIWYVATAHGGVWKTTSNGVTWIPMLQEQGLMSFGDVTVSQSNPDLVWAGGGESNNRQSTSWGSGVWKSTDGGATWTNMGLKESKHIHRIAIDPRDNNVVFVAATGALFGPGGERGVYKTTDGGATWKRVLSGDENTGANDIVISPKDPSTMFASMYARRRSECCFNGGSTSNALWRSQDNGETWSKVEGGYPTGLLGRISVDVSRSDPNVVYSLVEGVAAPTAPGGPGMQPQPAVPAGPQGLWRSNDGGETWTKVNGVNPRPMYFSKVVVDPTNPETVYYAGVGLHMSIDGGKTVETDAAMVTHDDVHAIWVNPSNPQHLIIGNDGGMATSYDQAKSWQFIPNLPVGLFYHVSFDMETPFNICGGMQDNYNWCGPSRSRFGRGIINDDWFQILGGDGFHAIPDPRDSRIVYTESQNGNMIRRNVVTGESKSIRPNALTVTPRPDSTDAYRWQWDAPMMISTHDAGVLMVAANKVFVSRDRGDSWQVISPDLTTNAKRDTITTMGLQGKDITIATHDGISQWPAIVSLGESPKRAGVIWTGTDDGTVSVTMDNGATWRNVTGNIPGLKKWAYVGEVVPSRFDAGRAYVVVANYRQNDYAPYLWVTEDSGSTFTRIDGGLAGEVTRTLTEDPKNQNVLYVGTETGLFVSLDRGKSWKRLQANLPNVRVDEIAIHPRDNAMVVATHGRAIFVLDNLAPVQELAAAREATRTLTVFSPGRALQMKYKDDRNDEFWGHQWFTGENPPADAVIQYNVVSAPSSMMVRISSGERVIREMMVPDAKRTVGIHTMCWDMRHAPIAFAAPTGGGPAGGPGGRTTAQPPVPGTRAPLPEPGYRARNLCGTPAGGGGFGGFGGGANVGPYATPGTYTVSLVVDNAVVDSKPLVVVADPEIRLTAPQRVAYDRIVTEMHDQHRATAAVVTRLNTLRTQIAQAQAKIDSASSTPLSRADSTRFAEVKAGYEAIRGRFGLPIPGVSAPAAGGGGFGGFAAPNPANVYGRFTALKSGVISIWETPSPAVQLQIRDTGRELERAVKDAEDLLDRATRAGRGLREKGITLAP